MSLNILFLGASGYVIIYVNVNHKKVVSYIVMQRNKIKWLP